VSVRVVDPFGVTADTELPTLLRATDAVAAPQLLRHGLSRLAADGVVHVRTIRVTRYKPGRRCVIEYDVEVEQSPGRVQSLTLLGKVRRRRSGRSAYALLSALWDGGFADDADDGVVVPEPVGDVPELRMWLQRRVSGRVATALLEAPAGEALARRVAEAAHKVHEAGVPSPSGRRHRMDDELRILHECLPQVARTEPQWEERIHRLLRACERLGRATPASPLCWIHRDFYGDQVIVGDGRLCLIDFDQYCHGDPAVDVGNFLGHVTEQSLRALGDPDGLADVKRALEERFLELSPQVAPATVRAYELLTLARHVYVSTKFADRRPFTEDLLTLSEERLGVAATGRALVPR
jgi:hypothetical protein